MIFRVVIHFLLIELLINVSEFNMKCKFYNWVRLLTFEDTRHRSFFAVRIVLVIKFWFESKLLLVSAQKI